MGSAGVDGSVELAEFDIFAYLRESSEPLSREVVIGVDDGTGSSASCNASVQRLNTRSSTGYVQMYTSVL